MKTIILLHGAIGSKDQLEILKQNLSEFKVYSFDFNGHGSDTSSDAFSIDSFANQLISFIESNNLAGTDIFGYSMGGMVALTAVMRKPELIDKIITLGTKFEWSPEIAKREVKMLNADIIEEKVPKFASVLESRHTGRGWKIVLSETAEMMIDLGNNPPQEWSKVKNPTKLMIGDADAMVSISETESVHNKITSSQFEILPEVQHPIEKVNIELLSSKIRTFLN